MREKKLIRAVSTSVASALLLMATLVGCNENSVTKKPDVSSDSSQTETAMERKDGERFEAVIVIEGQEETVKYEHVKNDKIGFELDYEYESLNRITESDYERFVSVYDDSKKPSNYLEIAYSSEKAEKTVKTAKSDLSKSYKTVTVESCELEGAGQCQRINVSEAKGSKTPKDSLQTVYIIPLGDGCIVAAAHYTIESAEGFGARFSQIVNTLSIIK